MAVEFLCAENGVQKPASIKMLRTKHEKAKQRQAARRYPPQKVKGVADNNAVKEKMLAWIVAQGVDLRSLSAKSRKKWRARARDFLGLPSLHHEFWDIYNETSH
jgi:hypothetical protein